MCQHRCLRVKDDRVWYCYACSKGGGARGLIAWTKGVSVSEVEEEFPSETPASLLRKIDSIEHAPQDSEDELLDIIDRYWISTAHYCRGFPVDPDKFFVALQDWVRNGYLTTIGETIRLSKMARDLVANAIQTATGWWESYPPLPMSRAEVRAWNERRDRRSESKERFTTRALERKELSLVALLELRGRHDEIWDRTAGSITRTSSSAAPPP